MENTKLLETKLPSLLLSYFEEAARSRDCADSNLKGESGTTPFRNLSFNEELSRFRCEINIRGVYGTNTHIFVKRIDNEYAMEIHLNIARTDVSEFIYTYKNNSEIKKMYEMLYGWYMLQEEDSISSVSNGILNEIEQLKNWNDPIKRAEMLSGSQKGVDEMCDMEMPEQQGAAHPEPMGL